MAGRGDAIVSPTPPGAGRFRDWVWPEPSSLDGNPGPGAGNRLGISLSSTIPIASSIGYGGGTTTISFVVNGIDCAALPSSPGAVGIGYRFDTMMVTHIKTALNLIPLEADDEQCFRVFVTMAAQVAPTPGTDYGWYMTTASTNGRVIADGAPGFGFQIADLNVVNFISRGGLGLVTFPLTAAPFDTTQFHTYELRITSANSAVNASLAVLIDNVAVTMPATLASWAGATALPVTQLYGGRCGFRPGLYNTSGVFNSLFVQKLRYISAPVMAATF